jgi:hypothetical protein
MMLRLAISILQAYIGSTPFRVGNDWYVIQKVDAPK